MERKISQSRKYLEMAVIAYNKAMRGEVEKKDNISLLRLCHPTDAAYAAFKLYSDGELTKEDASEFCTIIGSGYKERK